MKMQQIINAYKGANDLYRLPLPPRAGHALCMLRRQLEPHFKFAEEEQRKAMEALEARFGQDGGIAFPDAEKAAAFNERMQEVLTMDVDADFTPVTISLDSLGDERILPEVFDWLDGFVAFE